MFQVYNLYHFLQLTQYFHYCQQMNHKAIISSTLLNSKIQTKICLNYFLNTLVTFTFCVALTESFSLLLTCAPNMLRLEFGLSKPALSKKVQKRFLKDPSNLSDNKYQWLELLERISGQLCCISLQLNSIQKIHKIKQ